MKAGRPLMRFADNHNDEWTTTCDLEAGRWLRAGFHPDQLHPATGAPLEGAIEEPDPEADPSVAETLLRSSDEVLERVRRRSSVACAVVVVGLVLAVFGGLWWGGVL